MERELEQGECGNVRLEPLEPGEHETYCKTGQQAYRDHYLHLWPEQDPSPYIRTSFTNERIAQESREENTLHFMVCLGDRYIGIVKLVKYQQIRDLPQSAPMFLEKIYLLKRYTGKGYGQKILEQIESLSIKQGMKTLWLATMKKGFPLRFYQKYGFNIVGEQQLPFQESIPEERGMYILSKSLMGGTLGITSSAG